MAQFGYFMKYQIVSLQRSGTKFLSSWIDPSFTEFFLERTKTTTNEEWQSIKNSGNIGIDIEDIESKFNWLQKEKTQHSFIVNNQRGRNQFLKDEAGEWSIIDKASSESLNQVKIKSVLSKISTISLRKPVGIERKPEFGYDNATAIVEIYGNNSEEEKFSYILKLPK